MMSNKYTVIHTDSGHYLTVWCAIYEVVRHSSFKLHKMLCNATWATKNSQLGIPAKSIITEITSCNSHDF